MTDRADARLHDDDDIEGLDEFLQNPRFAAALEDTEARQEILTCLVKQRRAMKMSQTQVAEHMQTAQSFVSDLENGRTDTHLSTLQRYARAVAARLVVRLELPAHYPWQECAWTAPSEAMTARVRHSRSLSSVDVGAWKRRVEDRGGGRSPFRLSTKP